MTRKMTSKHTGFWNNYNNATMVTLDDAYGRYSVYKARAYEAIIDEMHRLGGMNPRITSNNSQFFSMAFEYPCPKTGIVRLRYYTGMNVYDFEVIIPDEFPVYLL